MKTYAYILSCLLILVLGTPCEYPVVNVPREARQSNWGGGSCVHATMVSLFRWQGRNQMADYWRRSYSGGENLRGLVAKFEKHGVRYAYTSTADVSFLEWSCRTRRGCGVVVLGGSHMIALVHLDNRWAALLDNNSISTFIWVPREQFLAEWRASGGWAITPVYSPAAPLP